MRSFDHAWRLEIYLSINPLDGFKVLIFCLVVLSKPAPKFIEIHVQQTFLLIGKTLIVLESFECHDYIKKFMNKCFISAKKRAKMCILLSYIESIAVSIFVLHQKLRRGPCLILQAVKILLTW